MNIATLTLPNENTRGVDEIERWDYHTAFSRNLGLVTPQEQQRLRNSRVAVVGMGGVGGIDLVTLARLGIGRFTIADPDRFEVANTNRQYGATRSTVGRLKAEVMAEILTEINPEIDVRVHNVPIGPENAEDFLADADVLVDGIEAFEIDIRRLLFRLAAEKGIHALGAGPVGFSTAWVIFRPDGMSFDQYFDLHDGMDSRAKFAAYLVGMAPKATHRSYMDLSYVDFKQRTGPSAALACQLCAGVVGAEVLKILLERGSVRAAPYYHQFDAFLNRYVCRRLHGGNRHPLQRLKRYWLTQFLRKQLSQ